jgi:hypothetical protein
MVASRLTIGTQQKAPRRTIDSGFSARPSHGSGCRAVAQAWERAPDLPEPPYRLRSNRRPNSVRRTNQSKQNQINPRKKAWFSLDFFGRIQTFQRVTANPNKKIFPRFIVRLSLGARLSSAALNKRALDSVIRKDIAQTFCFLKQMQGSRFARPWPIRRAKRGSETSSWAMVKRRSQQPTDGGKRASRPRQSRRARAPRSKAPACRGDLRSP